MPVITQFDKSAVCSFVTHLVVLGIIFGNHCILIHSSFEFVEIKMWFYLDLSDLYQSLYFLRDSQAFFSFDNSINNHHWLDK